MKNYFVKVGAFSLELFFFHETFCADNTVWFQKMSILPHRRDGKFLGEGGGGGSGSQRPKPLRKCMKPNWNFKWGGGKVLGKIPSMEEVWIITNYTKVVNYVDTEAKGMKTKTQLFIHLYTLM